MRRLGLILGALALLGLVVPVAPPPVAASPASERPYGLTIPDGYDGRTPVPLVVLLHGYGSNGAAQDDYFGLSALAQRAGFLVARPDGTRDRLGNRFWNATDACCDFYGSGVDDVAYLSAVIDEVAEAHRVDGRRVYLVGHSNGAFMAHRLACDRAERVAAIVTLAGMQWQDPGRCPAAGPVSALHVHGTNDPLIWYRGGATPKGRYPGAVATAGTWAAKNGCTGPLTAADRRLDLDHQVPGDDTRVERHTGCSGTAVELWTIEGGGHVPAFNDGWAPAIWEFMAAHPRPA